MRDKNDHNIKAGEGRQQVHVHLLPPNYHVHFNLMGIHSIVIINTHHYPKNIAPPNHHHDNQSRVSFIKSQINPGLFLAATNLLPKKTNSKN